MDKEEIADNELFNNNKSLIEKQIAFASELFQADVTTHILLESLAEGAIIIDSTSTILLVNERVEHMFGYSRQELIGKHHDIILPERYHGIHKKHMQSYFDNPKIRPMGLGLDLIALHKDGSEFPVEISLSFIKTINNYFVISFVSDISARKQVEKALTERNESLDAFAHTLAHDIKNSIAVITGFGTYIDQMIDEISSEEIRDSVATIISSAEKINHIIESLLLFSSISREDVPLSPVDMHPVIESVLERLRNVIQERSAEIILSDHFPMVMGYDSWIEEIWYNYISNALKYGGDPPVIQLGATSRDDGFVTYWVKDNGKGVRPDIIDSIFDTYQPRKDKNKKGYGLGLSIVKRIAEKINGSVGVQNSSDGGCVFYLVLPVVKH